MQSVLSLAKEYRSPIAPGLEDSSSWPWKVVRVIQNYESIYGSTSLCIANKVPVPPREILRDRRKVKKWIKAHKPDKPEPSPKTRPKGRR